MITGLAIAIAALAIIALALKMLNPLPRREGFARDLPVPAVASPLVEDAKALTREHDGETAVRLLTTGGDAFAMRLAMVRSARRTIDAQYYIWENDLSGRMLLAEIVRAADRGVRVRLLIDDNPTSGLDPMWAAVAAHENIAVRLFNPLTIRAFRPANYLFDFPRLNRRMHNKSLTVDSAATLVGGRNVGDEYFGAREKGLFIDVDALAIGAVVPDVEREFARYWTSEAAFPAETILPAEGAMSAASLSDPDFADTERVGRYLAAAEEAIAAFDFDRSAKDFHWAPVRLVADDPAKANGREHRSSLLASQIAPLFAQARERIELVSGYFVPGEKGTTLLTAAAKRGARVRVVTNSLQVTDVPIVQAGYAPYRKPLLRAGVQLFEAAPISESPKRQAHIAQTRFSGGGESVHAKTFAIDGRIIFVGSFNFDPRSALLNCEMGFVVDSPELARDLAVALDERLSDMAYSVSLDGSDRLSWSLGNGPGVRTWDVEPGTTRLSRAVVGALSLLPIEWLL